MLKFLNNIEEKFLVLNLLISTLIVFMNVVLRYVFSASLSWVDEAARYMFIWLIWIGADYTLANRKHLRIDIISAKLHGRARLLYLSRLPGSQARTRSRRTAAAFNGDADQYGLGLSMYPPLRDIYGHTSRF